MSAAQPYRPRQTQDTDLVAILAEDLPEFLERSAGDDPDYQLPDFVRKHLRSVVDCGDFLRGFLRFECESCETIRIVPFSCKSRVCPSCAGRRMNESAAFAVDRVLPRVPYRHWTISLPGELARACAFDPSLSAAIFGRFATARRKWPERVGCSRWGRWSPSRR